MKKINFLIFLFTLLLISQNLPAQQYNSLIVKLKPGNQLLFKQLALNAKVDFRSLMPDKLLKSDSKNKILSSKAKNLIEDFNLHIVVDSKNSDFLSSLFASGLIESIEPNYIFHVEQIENGSSDPLVKDQWALEQVNAFKAWEKATGQGIIVGVVDSGIDFNHPDLIPNLFINKLEDINGNGKIDPADYNGIDEDNNGFVDDIIGYDFVDQTISNFGDASIPDGNPADENGHGTYVSGVIAAAGNNNEGIIGLAFNSKILTARAIDATGDGEADDIAAAIVYVALNGARVINLSFGDTIVSPVINDACAFANEMGCVIAASAGNKNVPSPHYPSGHSPVISCAGSAKNYSRYSSSNFGSFIDLAAPASDVLTTLPGGSYGSKSGTSFAAPYVAAAAALILEIHPDFTPLQVRGLLNSTAQDFGKQGWDSLFGSGILNAAAALDAVGLTELAIFEPAQGSLINTDKIQYLPIIGTVATPLFEYYRLDVGKGRLPSYWTFVSDTLDKQIIKDTIGILNINALEPGLYTLRLFVKLRNNNSLERRISFEILNSDSALKFDNFNVLNAYFEDSRAVIISANTNRNARFFVKFRPKDSQAEWRYVNNYEQAHRHQFALIGREAEVGVEMNAIAYAVADEGDTAVYEFTFTRQSDAFTTSGFTQKSYSLPRSYLLNKVSDFYSQNPSIIVNDMKDVAIRKAQSYEFQNNQFVLRDSLLSNNVKVIADIGETNGDGIPEAAFSYIAESYGTTLTQSSSSKGSPFERTLYQSPFELDQSVEFLFDFDKDGRDEIIARDDTSYFLIDYDNGQYRISARTMLEPNHLRMGVEKGSAAGDFDNDGNIELAFTNQYGYIFIYQFLNGSFSKEKIFDTDIALSNMYMTSLDVDGDGVKEILNSTHTTKIFSGNERLGAPLWLYRLIKSKGPDVYDIVWSDYSYGFRVGPTSNVNISYRNGITSANLDADSGDEAIMLAFPNTYVFKWNKSASKFEPFWYYPFTLSSSALVYDFDKNAINEIGISTFSETSFFEYSGSLTSPSTPAGIDAWALSSNSAYLKWNKSLNASSYKIYEIRQIGNQLQAFEIAVSNDNFITLNNLKSNSLYNFAIKSINPSLSPSESDFSDLVSVQLHELIKPLSAKIVKAQSLEISFNGKLPHHTLSSGNFVFVSDSLKQIPLSVITSSDSLAVLFFADSLTAGSSKIYVSSFRDFYNSPTLSDTLDIDIFYPEDIVKLYLKKLQFLGISGRSLLQVEFSEPVDSSAENPAFWQIQPFGKVLNVEISQNDSSKILINLSSDLRKGARGKNFTITALPQIKSLFGNYMTSGPGNTLGFAFSAPDLLEPYVYPCPVKLSELSDIYFANITAHAEIVIMEMNGNLISRLIERDSNGGALWNGRDLNGDIIKPGIYLYRISGTNESGEEFESELNKFIVVP